MKLTLDARPLSHSLSGIGRYTTEILKRIAPQCNLQMLTDEPLKTKIRPAGEKLIQRHKLPYSLSKLLWQQQQIPQALKKEMPDVFWSPRHHLPLFGCKKIPMVLTIHDLVYRKMPETMKRSNWAMEKLLLAASTRRANHIIAVSHATKQSLIEELNVPEHKISVIHSAYVEPARVDLPQRAKPYILFLGTLEPRKNIERLIDAYLALPLYLQEKYDLVLAGNLGWKSEKLQAKIAAHANKIDTIGFVEDAVAVGLLSQARCFAFPSLYEGFGLPLLEAMRFDCPVLTSTDPACMEVSGDAALHIDPLSVDSIAQGLQKILEDDLLCETLIQNGRANLQRFSWDISADQHLKVFKDIMRGGG
jgi:glycosyltransferase involved in cell wall biosynthesis